MHHRGPAAVLKKVTVRGALCVWTGKSACMASMVPYVMVTAAIHALHLLCYPVVHGKLFCMLLSICIHCSWGDRQPAAGVSRCFNSCCKLN